MHALMADLFVLLLALDGHTVSTPLPKLCERSETLEHLKSLWSAR